MFYEDSVSIVTFYVDGLPQNPNQSITFSQIVPHFHPFPLQSYFHMDLRFFTLLKGSSGNIFL